LQVQPRQSEVSVGDQPCQEVSVDGSDADVDVGCDGEGGLPEQRQGDLIPQELVGDAQHSGDGETGARSTNHVKVGQFRGGGGAEDGDVCVQGDVQAQGQGVTSQRTSRSEQRVDQLFDQSTRCTELRQEGDDVVDGCEDEVEDGAEESENGAQKAAQEVVHVEVDVGSDCDSVGEEGVEVLGQDRVDWRGGVSVVALGVSLEATDTREARIACVVVVTGGS